ncbi:MAG: tRNA pseudouridine(38-40) synthase TruA [Saprospiraceae bacterium]|nr:tRNA pseudouridine(38-40) synthase TruA [Saprospiraceae bacterium]
MRWKIQLSYLGTSYCGWQRQPSDPSVQQTMEEAFSLILRQPIEIIGCGRTDTGVHARSYVAHTDVEDFTLNEKLVYHLNALLPKDIAIHHIEETSPEFHARFDAIERYYRYHIHFHKDPFLNGLSCFLHQHIPFDQQKMKEAASLLLQYHQFKPFCKTGSDADHFKCTLTESAWNFTNDHAVYSIKANRFLRGMVRLIVGACLNVGLGKISLAELKDSLDQQTILEHAWSVPAEGLYLENVVYPAG